MAIRYPNATRNAAIDVVNTLLSAGAAAPTLTVYSGTQPADPNSAASGTTLVTFTLNDPPFGAPANGTITLDVDPAISATASAAGTAGWFRAFDSNGTAVFDGSAGTSGADLILNTTAITAGGSVSITLGTLTEAAG